MLFILRHINIIPYMGLYVLFYLPGRPVIEVLMPDGAVVGVIYENPVEPMPAALRSTDHVQMYALQLLETGLAFKNFLETVQVPNRARMLRTMKVMMMLLKGNKANTKYADEILRFLIHQLAILSEREAHFMFYSMFVNTRGMIDSNIACDLQMEHIVRTCKKHIKHLQSNKCEDTIRKRTGALAAINEVIRNYDAETKPPKRSSKHSTRSKEDDENAMTQDLRELKPFETTIDRCHAHFADITDSLMSHFDFWHFGRWMKRRINEHAINLGN